jgi:hypothetical protein
MIKDRKYKLLFLLGTIFIVIVINRLLPIHDFHLQDILINLSSIAILSILWAFLLKYIIKRRNGR